MTPYDAAKTDSPEPLDLAVVEGAIDTVAQWYVDNGELAELFATLYFGFGSIHEAMFQLRLPEPLNRDFAEIERKLRAVKSLIDEEVVKQSAYQEKDDE